MVVSFNKQIKAHLRLSEFKMNSSKTISLYCSYMFMVWCLLTIRWRIHSHVNGRILEEIKKRNMQCLYMFKKMAVVSLNVKQLSHKGLCTLYIYEETIRSLHQPVRTDLIFIVDLKHSNSLSLWHRFGSLEKKHRIHYVYFVWCYTATYMSLTCSD